MLRLFTSAIAIVTLTQIVSGAAAKELICPDAACFPGYFLPAWPNGRAHNFQPELRDGVPVVKDFPSDPEGYYGAGCVWSWRPVATPNGPQWRMGRYCVTY
jgi:hypothetical protein